MSLKPTEQLRIIHDELNRQRDIVDRRFANMYTRASILVVAAGVTPGVNALVRPEVWQLLSGVFAVVAAGYGLWILKPITDLDAVIAGHVVSYLEKKPYTVEWQIVKDNESALRADLIRLAKAGANVEIGYIFLVISWIVSIAIAILHH